MHSIKILDIGVFESINTGISMDIVTKFVHKNELETRELLLKYRVCIWILTITQTGAAHTILTDL